MIGLSFCLSDLINITNNPLQLGECLSERGDYIWHDPMEWHIPSSVFDWFHCL
jgi:hypothetical protein